jgi:hypothetical protein
MKDTLMSHHYRQGGLDEHYDSDEQDEPTFQRLRKQTGKVIKNGERQQASKEFGKRINKFHKERRRHEGPGKP